MTQTVVTESEAETEAAGCELARDLTSGAVVLLTGPLGAGKTAFIRGMAEGLGGDAAAVSSPTFTIIQEYTGGAGLHHVDLYRLTPAEVPDLGLDDLVSDGVTAVEWPDRWAGAPADAIQVVIEPLGGDRRLVTIAR